MKSSFSLIQKIASWQSAGHIHADRSSIESKISEAALSNEISLREKTALLALGEELPVTTASLQMVDTFLSARKIAASKRTADSDATLDTLIHGVDQLAPVVEESGDASLLMICKMLGEFLNRLKTSRNTSSKEQGGYERVGMGELLAN